MEVNKISKKLTNIPRWRTIEVIEDKSYESSKNIEQKEKDEKRKDNWKSQSYGLTSENLEFGKEEIKGK